MMQDLRSPEAKARAEREYAERRAKERKLEEVVAEDRAKGGSWRPIESMPFKAYAEGYSRDATVLVTDGKEVAVATVSDRVGRPVKQIEPPTYTLTDDGPILMGGKYEEYDRPQWWFDWEFTDELSSDSEMWGKDEIDFVPTHYMPLPLPPND
jgi:hypothetical protein